MNKKILCSLLSICTLSNISAAVPLLIFAGQSNMVGCRTDIDFLTGPQKARQPNVYFFGPNDQGSTWSTVELGTHPTQMEQTVSGKGFGPEAVVGKTLVEKGLFPRVLSVKYVHNGGGDRSFLASPAEVRETKLYSTWAPGTEDPEVLSLYIELLARVKAAQAAYTEEFGEETYIAGIFWMQGESDALYANTAKQYEANLRRFILALRKDLQDADLPFIYGRIRDGNIFPEDAVVRSAQDTLAEQSSPSYFPRVAKVDTDSFEMFSAIDPTASDGSGHFSTQGTWQLGEAMAEAFINLVAHPSPVENHPRQ